MKALILLLLLSFHVNATGKGLGISYADLMGSMDSYFTMERMDLPGGEPRYLGETEDKTAAVEVIGPKQELTQVTMIFTLPMESPETILRNSDLVLQLIKSVLPNWNTGESWVSGALIESSKTGLIQDTVVDEKRVFLKVISESKIILLSFKHQSQPVPSDDDLQI